MGERGKETGRFLSNREGMISKKLQLTQVTVALISKLRTLCPFKLNFVESGIHIGPIPTCTAVDKS